jgi:outer membrane protein
MQQMRGFGLSSLAAAALLALAPGAHAEVMTLSEALAIVYQTNPQIGAEVAQLAATDEEVAKADAGWRPTLSATGSYGLQYQHESLTGAFAKLVAPPPGTVPTLTGQVVLSQPVFTSGRTAAEIDRAKALFRQERARFVGTEEQVLLNAATAYFDVIRDAKIYILEQENVASLQKQLDATQKEFALKDVTKTDVAQAAARLSGAQASLAVAQGNLAASRAAYEQMVGRKPDVLRTPAYPDLPGTLPEVIAAALKLNPSLMGALESERAAAFAIDDATGALGPQVSIQGQYLYQKNSAATTFNGTDHVGAVVAQVTVPIYQGGSEYAEIRQQEQLHGQSQLQILVTERQVRQAAESSWKTFKAAQAAIQLDLAQQQADQTAYEGVQKEQKAGTRTVLDVLNAEQELVNAEIAVVQSEHDAYADAFQILGVMGLLEAKSLGLKVKLYDVSDQYSAGWRSGLTD